MNTKGMKIGAGLLILCFYIAIIMYSFFEIFNIDLINNYIVSLTFEIMGFVLLGFVTVFSMCSKSIKLGMLVPILICTIVHNVIVNVINIFVVQVLVSSSILLLLNLIVMFVYFLITIPMFIIGKR